MVTSVRSFLSTGAAFLTLLTALSPAWAASPSGAVIREPGAVYLEDVVKKPVRVTLLADTPIFYQADRERLLGIMRKGQVVEIQAIGDTVYRVRGMAQQGQVAGWVEPRFLAPLKPEFLDSVRQNAARHDQVQALLARKEVAINMTPEEVNAAIGVPSKKTSRLDAGGRQEVWEYVRYERVPQQTTGRDLAGRLVTTVVYVKVPSGKLSVVFENNLVSSLEQTEGTNERDGRAKIVSAPLVLAF